MSSLRRVNHFLSLVKFSHTIFALPFALLGFFLGVLDHGVLSFRKLLLVVLAMVFARSAAMAFNRWLDRSIDVRNPRRQSGKYPPAPSLPAPRSGSWRSTACCFWSRPGS